MNSKLAGPCLLPECGRIAPGHARRCVAAAAFLLAAPFFSSCTRPAEEDANRIVYSIWGSVAEEAVEAEIIRGFREKHPEVEVEVMTIGSRYAEKVQAMMVGRVAPDVMAVPMHLYDEWAARGVLLDLSEEFFALHEESPIMPVPFRAFVRKHGVFALPATCDGPATYYNRGALQKAGVTIPEDGLTWDYILEIGPRLARRAGNPDAPTEFAFVMPQYLIFFWQHGVTFFDDLFEPSKVTVNTPEAVRALDQIRRLMWSGLAVPADVARDEGAFQIFRDGRVAFFFDSRFRTVDLDGRATFDWDITPLPAGPVSRVGWHGGWSLAVWKHSPRQEAALKFVRYYASPEAASRAMDLQRYVPVFEQLAFGDFLEQRPPENIHHFAETMREGASEFTLYAPGAQEVRRLVHNRVQQSLTQPTVSSQRIIETLETDLNRWLAKR